MSSVHDVNTTGTFDQLGNGDHEITSSFHVGLSTTGDDGSAFRTQNDPADPYQRTNIIEREGVIDIRCTTLDVVHGYLDPASDDAATLFIIEFNFDNRKNARRIKEANLFLVFAAMHPQDDPPVVLKTEPFGSMIMVETVQRVDTEKGASMSLGPPPPIGANVGMQLAWKRIESREACNATKVVGSIDLVGRNWGLPNRASWTLLENATDKTGIPTKLRAAVLLKRTSDQPFQCTVKINAEVDFVSSLERLVGLAERTPKDDPVLFDPSCSPTQNLQVYDSESLGGVDLRSISGVTFKTVFDGAVTHV